jgi:DNA-binding GntR family transcriptional regulator
MYVTAKIENDLAKGILLSLARQTLHLTRIALLNKANRQLWIENWAKMVRAVKHSEPLAAGAAMRSIVENVCVAVLQILAEAQSNDMDEADRHA